MDQRNHWCCKKKWNRTELMSVPFLLQQVNYVPQLAQNVLPCTDWPRLQGFILHVLLQDPTRERERERERESERERETERERERDTQALHFHHIKTAPITPKNAAQKCTRTLAGNPRLNAALRDGFTS